MEQGFFVLGRYNELCGSILALWLFDKHEKPKCRSFFGKP